YDWNWIKEKGFFVDSIEGKTIVIFGNSDGLSFSAWYVPLPFDQVNTAQFQIGKLLLKNEVVYSNGIMQKLPKMNGGEIAEIEGEFKLQPAPVYQEFWHSWRTFHPNSKRFPK
ncbi:MAG: hypothetical protein IT244_08155, partial [Bacteroidia bacterium]|nr:hypothetical protein [Bacteroidia bacterium]